jgi:hypothetical protein
MMPFWCPALSVLAIWMGVSVRNLWRVGLILRIIDAVL